MKSPKGFGKSYFTLASILAHTVQRKIESQTIKIDHLLANVTPKETTEVDENDPPAELLNLFLVTNAKPCHCKCFYKLRTRIILKINHYIPRCPYYATWFAFRRTGVHPPYITF